jgi:hypothetical protein
MRTVADYACALLLILVVEVGAAVGRVLLKSSRPAKAVWQLGFRLLTVPVEKAPARRSRPVASR